VTAVEEEAGKPFAQKDLILDDHRPHGICAVNVVPCPAAVSMCTLPP
jgi:hypothetical protein